MQLTDILGLVQLDHVGQLEVPRDHRDLPQVELSEQHSTTANE